MYRNAIADDEMMLFIQPCEKHFSLWMWNVNFDLDAAFLDRNMNILEIVHMTAYPDQKDPRFFFDKMYVSSYPVKYALEGKKGFFERNNLKVGDHIRFLVPGNILREERIFKD
jgi:uncharacterized membrane protein (UPF0127 family)